MKIKTSEATPIQLDWLVAVCKGMKVWAAAPAAMWDDYSPATDWADAGPIIERESISIERKHDGWWMASCKYHYADDPMYLVLGDTPLIAAMRCYVASKLGEYVDVPF